MTASFSFQEHKGMKSIQILVCLNFGESCCATVYVNDVKKQNSSSTIKIRCLTSTNNGLISGGF